MKPSVRALGIVALTIFTGAVPVTGAPADNAGNRLTHLDGDDPYHVGRNFPRLTTPQWLGEEGVDAVVILSIDDLRDIGHYEGYLRPILERLKKIDGRAPVSIMTCAADAKHPQIQSWLAEGLSIEAHTVDHPCPILQNGDFYFFGFDVAKIFAECFHFWMIFVVKVSGLFDGDEQGWRIWL